MNDPELESFKRLIDLRSYAASHGYQRDDRASWRGTDVMRHPTTGDKIVVKFGTKRAPDHWGYYSVRQDGDHGSIIDFAQRRLNVSLGAVRKELRPWVGEPPVKVPSFPPPQKTIFKDRAHVEAEYARTESARRHPYLENERSVPAALLALDRFAGRIRIDDRGNAVLPHFDADGVLTGFEKKNKGFTGFSSGGSKSLWLSHALNNDMRLVFCEGAIDALSYAVLFPDDHARYASIGGKPNPIQPELIRAAAARMPLGSEIVAAMDADAEGRKLADVVERAVELSGRLDLRFRIHEPVGFKDWNDVLKAGRKVAAGPTHAPEARPA
jgi:hypothetical protein